MASNNLLLTLPEDELENQEFCCPWGGPNVLPLACIVYSMYYVHVQYTSTNEIVGEWEEIPQMIIELLSVICLMLQC